MRNKRSVSVMVLGAAIWFFAAGFSGPAVAHHVLGRPSYGLDEHSNTPPGEQLEVTSGKYIATFMAFPAFPQPHEPARVNLYLSTFDGGDSYEGPVAFSIRKEGWFSGDEKPLGVQIVDDKVYRQSFEVSERGDYVIVARFESGKDVHVLEFPLLIGEAAVSNTLTVGAGAAVIALIVLTLMNRRRFTRAKISHVRDGARDRPPGSGPDHGMLGRGH